MESNDSPEILDRGETSDIPGLPLGAAYQLTAPKNQTNNNNKHQHPLSLIIKVKINDWFK